MASLRPSVVSSCAIVPVPTKAPSSAPCAGTSSAGEPPAPALPPPPPRPPRPLVPALPPPPRPPSPFVPALPPPPRAGETARARASAAAAARCPPRPCPPIAPNPAAPPAPASPVVPAAASRRRSGSAADSRGATRACDSAGPSATVRTRHAGRTSCTGRSSAAAVVRLVRLRAREQGEKTEREAEADVPGHGLSGTQS